MFFRGNDRGPGTYITSRIEFSKCSIHTILEALKSVKFILDSLKWKINIFANNNFSNILPRKLKKKYKS